MRCAHCAAPKAKNRWTATLCADGRKRRSKYLCDACDEELNRIVMTFLTIPDIERKMREYLG